MAKKIQDINAEYLIDADAIKEIEGDIIQTVPSLDLALSGGIAEGTTTNIAGKPKCGKTTLCLEIIASAQRMGKECYYADVEGRLRSDLLSTIDNLIWTKEQAEEKNTQVLKIIRSTEDTFLTAEMYLDILENLLKNRKGCLVILDSIAALCTESTQAAQAADSVKMAGVPTLMYRFLRKLAQIMPTRKTTLITITHLQANPSPYGGPVQVGGNAIQYFASNRLVCHSVEKDKNKEGDVSGQIAVFKCESSALGPPNGLAPVHITYGNGVNKVMNLITTCVGLGLIVQSGAWFQWREQKFQGMENTYLFFKQNPEAYKELDNEFRALL